MANHKDRIIFIVGPTAVGKTEIAAELARYMPVEIISCDSMQVYKGMDIITSKPSQPLVKNIPHHLISGVPVTEDYDVSKYRKEAIGKIKEILKKGKTPIFVGGTGLYMSVLIDGIFEVKTENPGIRKKLYREIEVKGSNYLHDKLKKADPEAALRIHPNDTKRIVRALEVFESTGQPISKLQKERKGLANEYDIRIFCLNMERDKLYQRIEERVDKMFNKGLMEEVKKLLKLKLSRTASFAIGIKELKGHFDGLYDLEEAKNLIKKNTRNYAKRQLTWFRKDKRIKWIEVDEQDKPIAIARKILKETI